MKPLGHASHLTNSSMNYDELSKHAEELSYRDKLKLSQLLIQLARKEEEDQNPGKRNALSKPVPSDPALVQSVADKLKKLRPTRKQALLNSIAAMFQFQGGISDKDKEQLLSQLLAKRHFTITDDGHVHYPTTEKA